MLPHVIAVVAVFLVKAHHGQELRPEDARHLRVRPQGLRRAVPGQELFQLRPDPLRGDVPQQLPVPAEGGRRVRLNGKSQLGGEPQPPQNAQSVLAEPAVRVPHAPQHPRRQIRPAVQRVQHPPRPVRRQGVDGEVPAAQVRLQGVGEGHGLRPPVVPVGPVPAEGGDLHAAQRRFHGDGAVAEPGGHRPIREQGHGLLRQGGGGHVPVPGGPAQQAVPDAAPHAPGAMARRLQRIQKLPHRSWDPDGRHGRASPLISQLHFQSFHTIIKYLVRDPGLWEPL